MKEKIIEEFDKLLQYSLQKINLLHLFLVNKYNLNKSSYKFLTPNDEAENIEEYNKALNEALENNNVKNIAISGSYGAGKSSIIRTFEKNNPKYKILDISLATFKPKNNTNLKEDSTDLSLIEKSILEQMFYKVQNKKIPQSRLKKINRLKLIPLKILSVLLVLLCYFIVFKSEKIENILIW